MKNNKVMPIIKNEVERSIKNKSFVILNILLLIVVVIGINYKNIKAIFKNNNIDLESSITIYLKDSDNIVGDELSKAFENYSNVTVDKVSSIDEYKTEELDKNKLLLEVEKSNTEYIHAILTTKESVYFGYIDTITSTLNSLKDKMVLENSNLTEDELKTIKQDVNLNRVMISPVIDTNEKTSFIQLITNYIIFFILLLCLNKIANTISQEKLSKSIEYILTSISAKQYLISKILSMALIVIVQFIFILAYVIIAVMASTLITKFSGNIEGVSSIDISSYISLRTVGYVLLTIIYMCLTTFLQGLLQALMSAKTTNIQEAGNATLMLVTVNLVLYGIASVMISPLKTASPIAYILSVLPIASMYFVPSMLLIGQANLMQVILSLVILVASIPLFLILIQKPFKNAILDYTGKKDKKIEGIEKIIATREYQEKLIERKESSKYGLVVGFSVILLIILQLLTGLVTEIISPLLANKITFISKDDITLILMCIAFVISVYLPYLILKLYLPDDSYKNDESNQNKKKSFIKSLKYIVISIPIISVIQMICSFAIEKFGINSDIADSIGLFNYSGRLASVLMFIEIAILPAIFEELFIRKGVYGVLRRRGAIFATIVSALVFATIHLNFSQFIFALLIGILFAIVREKTGKLYPTMILHLLNNGAAVIEVLFYEHTTFMNIFTYVKIGLNAIGFAILIYMLYSKFMQLKDKEKIKELKEKLDYRKIKLNVTENMFVFKDYTFFIATLLSIVIFATIEKLI